VRRGKLGVTIQPVTSEIARSLGLSQVSGALVNNVEPGSPADKAGVRRGDVITAINGDNVRDGNELRNEVAQAMPGTSVTLQIVRDGREQTLKATLGELEPSKGARSDGSPADPGGFGMTIEPLTSERARQLGVAASGGVIVADVRPSSRAAEAGLRSGDVISEVDGKAVASADALRSALQTGDRPALLLVHRGNATLYLTIERGDR
jgi:serine protease Do